MGFEVDNCILAKQVHDENTVSYAHEYDLQKPAKRYKYAIEAKYQKKKSQGYENLNRLRRRIEWFLNLDRHKRHHDQPWFLRVMTIVVLKFLFGAGIVKEYANLCKDFNVDRIQQQCFINAARRWGKTLITCIFIASMTMEIPAFTCIVFSNSLRPALLMMTAIKELIDCDKEWRMKFKFDKYNAQQIVFSMVEDMITKVQCVPANEKISGK